MEERLTRIEAAVRTGRLRSRDVLQQRLLVCFLAYALYRTLEGLAKAKGLGMKARKVLASLSSIKSGDIILPLVDGRELRLRRVSRPDTLQAELLTKLGLELPERVGTDSLSGPV